MSKSILVMDTPEKCEDCIFFYQYNKDDVDSAYCRAFEEEKKTSIMWKPDWCPLRDLPEKYKTVSMGFERGYNACIKEILGKNI